jgi:hypothetical protein
MGTNTDFEPSAGRTPTLTVLTFRPSPLGLSLTWNVFVDSGVRGRVEYCFFISVSLAEVEPALVTPAEDSAIAVLVTGPCCNMFSIWR